MSNHYIHDAERLKYKKGVNNELTGICYFDDGYRYLLNGIETNKEEYNFMIKFHEPNLTFGLTDINNMLKNIYSQLTRAMIKEVRKRMSTSTVYNPYYNPSYKPPPSYTKLRKGKY